MLSSILLSTIVLYTFVCSHTRRTMILSAERDNIDQYI